MKRFVVVQVNGQNYECERPVGARLIRACVEAIGGQVTRVWIEDATPSATEVKLSDEESPDWESYED